MLLANIFQSVMVLIFLCSQVLTCITSVVDVLLLGVHAGVWYYEVSTTGLMVLVLSY